MKKYIVNKLAFVILPLIATIIIIVYFIFLFSKSYTYMNVINLVIDAIILIYYFRNFCTKIYGDEIYIDFYTVFKKYHVLRSDITDVKCASFMASIKCNSHRFFCIHN